jgi:threonine dehydrogenase-like Zn-dependent dehydrogenase
MKASDLFVECLEEEAPSRIIQRRVEEYSLRLALLMTIGAGENNLALLEALEAFMGAEGSVPWSRPLFDTIAVIGLGLIGSSVARGLKARELARRLVGYDISEDVRARASKLGFCEVAATPQAAVAGAELVVLAVLPVGATAAAVVVAPSLKDGAVVTELRVCAPLTNCSRAASLATWTKGSTNITA